MMFGRVEGIVEPMQDDTTRLRLTVHLETSAGFSIVRQETVARLVGANESNLAWQADQYTQETIGVHLATEGWEAIGQGDLTRAEPGEIARSATYAVRRV